MERLSAEMRKKPCLPVRALQFGEGNFLRGFADYMLDIANERAGLGAGVVLVKPLPSSTLEPFHAQDCLYTVLLRGVENGQAVEEARLITAVQDAVSPYEEYEKYAAYARLDTLRFILSNTTEAGIALDESDSLTLCPPRTYPGKLCKFLFERAEAFNYSPDKGLIILPTELIDDNGLQLQRCVKALARAWKLGPKFEQWLDDACIFASTLVDRIVTGYPREEAERLEIWNRLGYEDRLLVTGEPFALWVIEAPQDISAELPLPACGLPVIFTKDYRPYKQRKVRILNGAHTAFVPAAFQCGHDTVLDAMRDPLLRRFMQDTLQNEVIPTLSLPREELTAFAEAVKSRFENPFIHHALLSICLNGVSKWRARCLPSLLDYLEREGRLPARLSFSLAALTTLYYGGRLKDGRLLCQRGKDSYSLQDEPEVLRFFDESGDHSPAETARAFLRQERFWGRDLTRVPGLEHSVRESVEDILKKGMPAAMAERFGG